MKTKNKRQDIRKQKEKSEFDQRVLDVRRTTRVVAGGRRFTFRATIAIGNRKGTVGVGVGKSVDVASAVAKAFENAKKHLIFVALTKSQSVSREVTGKETASRVLLKPAKEGRGLVAGGPIRAIADLAGIRNLTAKILGRTSNKLNNARATIEALMKLNTS